MPDDESPDNVLQIRPGQPPQAPAPPTFSPAASAAGETPAHIRTSAFDAPPAPVTPDLVPATFRSDGLPDRGPHGPGGDAGPPRTGALSMAAVLAIALAAFEGLRTWIQEAGPRRAERAKHQREVELLAAKADADAARFAAQATHERAKASTQNSRVQPGHEYGRNTLNGRAGGPGKGGGPSGPGSSRKAPSSPHSSPSGGRTGSSSGGLSGARGGSRGHSSGAENRGGHPKPGGLRPGASKTGSGSNRSGGRDSKNPSSGGLGAWLQRRRGKHGTGAGSGGSKPAGSRPAKDRDTNGKPHAAATGGRSLKDAARKAMQDQWNSRSHLRPFKPKQKPPGKSGLGKSNPLPKDSQTGGATPGTGPSPGGTRTTFWQAVGETARQRWNKRRGAGHHTRRNDPPHPGPETPAASAGGAANPGGPDPKRPGPGAKPGPGGPENHSGPTFTWGPRTSPWESGPETGPEPAMTITIERADGGPSAASRHSGRRPPSRTPAGVTTGKRALPRAPQRPAGKRPGTTRRKDPIPMEPVPRTAGGAAPTRTATEHATDINLDQALAALHHLVNEGMNTHDDCNALAAGARKLLGALEEFTNDLAAAHNVTDPRVHQELAQTIELVSYLLSLARQMSKDALAAAELAEACEFAMNRDYRPLSNATADAGLYTPSSEIHNRN